MGPIGRHASGRARQFTPRGAGMEKAVTSVSALLQSVRCPVASRSPWSGQYGTDSSSPNKRASLSFEECDQIFALDRSEHHWKLVDIARKKHALCEGKSICTGVELGAHEVKQAIEILLWALAQQEVEIDKVSRPKSPRPALDHELAVERRPSGRLSGSLAPSSADRKPGSDPASTTRSWIHVPPSKVLSEPSTSSPRNRPPSINGTSAWGRRRSPWRRWRRGGCAGRSSNAGWPRAWARVVA